MLKTRKTIAIISILIFLLSSCAEAAKTEAANKQWLQNLACTFPCWQNITPSETEFDDVVAILQDAKIEVHSVTEDEIDFVFEKNIYGSVHKASNGTVDPIILAVHYAKLGMGDWEQVIGTPERIHLIRDYDGSYCIATLLYPDYGTVLEVSLKNKKSIGSEWWECRVNLTSDSEIFRVVLISSNLDDSEFWKRAYSNLGNTNKEWGYGYMEWQGYGEYP